MATYVDRVQLLFLFLSVSEAIVSQLYTVNFEFDSKAPMYTPSDTLPAASLPICASVCGNRCKCFSYNSQTKMCRLHSSCDTTNMTVRNTEWRSYTTPTMQPKECKDLYHSGKVDSGVYTIYPWERSDPNYRPVQVYCDMETEGGNDAIHQLTKGMYSYLYIGIESRLSESIMFQLYEEFSISGEDKNYTLHIERPKIGTLGECLHRNHANMPFSTYDVDNDKEFELNCAFDYLGEYKENLDEEISCLRKNTLGLVLSLWFSRPVEIKSDSICTSDIDPSGCKGYTPPYTI
uniref:Fibrinogen C-terminal domain-containing protein n=1 Tax=Magallana gigas TaxID=29159 RepID=A0A8W8JPL1_MAGGI